MGCFKRRLMQFLKPPQSNKVYQEIAAWLHVCKLVFGLTIHVVIN